MATKGLTPVAGRASRGILSGPKLVRREPDLRELLLREDARAVWDRIQELISSTDSTAPPDQVTQDMFLALLATDRLAAYLSEDYAEDQIILDLLCLLSNENVSKVCAD